MRLIDPGPGELMDRETILVKKIAAMAMAGKPTDHFAEELIKIQERFTKSSYRLDPGEHLIYRKALSLVNGRIWDAIDNLRASKTDFDAAHWGRTAMYGNDERARLIAELNAKCGFSVGQEKVT